MKRLLDRIYNSAFIRLSNDNLKHIEHYSYSLIVSNDKGFETVYLNIKKCYKIIYSIAISINTYIFMELIPT